MGLFKALFCLPGLARLPVKLTIHPREPRLMVGGSANPAVTLRPLTHRPRRPLPSQSSLETQLLASCTLSDLMSDLNLFWT